MESRQVRLGRFQRGPAKLSEVLRRCPKKMWMFRPEEGRWSIHEIILHLADSEAESYIRCRQFIAEPGTDAVAYDASAWAKSLGYFHQSTREALGLITRLRKMTHQILLYIPEAVWSHTARHPKKGTFTLDQWLDIQTSHIEHHITQIQQNYEAWARIDVPRKPARSRAELEAQPSYAAAKFSSSFAD